MEIICHMVIVEVLVAEEVDGGEEDNVEGAIERTGKAVLL